MEQKPTKSRIAEAAGVTSQVLVVLMVLGGWILYWDKQHTPRKYSKEEVMTAEKMCGYTIAQRSLLLRASSARMPLPADQSECASYFTESVAYIRRNDERPPEDPFQTIAE